MPKRTPISRSTATRFVSSSSPALYLDRWADRLQDPESPASRELSRELDEKEIRGWVNALQNVAALLRQGDFLPDGSCYTAVDRQQG